MVFSLIFCRKKEEESEPHDGIEHIPVYPSDSINQFRFKAGSYWIYKKSTSTIYDTVKLTKTEVRVCNTQPCDLFPSETCYDFYSYNMEFYSSYYSNYRWQGVLDNSYSTGVGQYCQRYFIYTLGITGGDSIGGTQNYVYYANQPLALPTNTFSSVTKIRAANQNVGYIFNSASGYGATIYISPGIGIVRKEVQTGASIYDIWDLVSWNVIQ